MGVEQEPTGEAEQPEIVVRVDDVDAMVDRLRSRGRGHRSAGPGVGRRHAWLHDTDGRPISIYAPIDPPRG